ncbi:MAG: Clp1/GlmU family protein [Acidilobus sp.]
MEAGNDVELLGHRPERGVRLVVPVGRSIIIVGDGQVRVSGGSVTPCVPSSLEVLKQLAESLTGRKPILLVGPADSGKSTLASYIYNTGLSDVIASLDVGQNEVYCPGFAAVSSPIRPSVPGSARGPARACFVGDFTPRGLEARFLYCALRLLRGVGRAVIDTDGWIEGEGLVLKAAVAEAIDAVVVAIGLGDEARRVMASYIGDIVAFGRFAPRTKSQAERRTNRDRLIASCLSGSRRRPISAELLTERPPKGGLEDLLASAFGQGEDHFAIIERASERSRTLTLLTSYEGRIDAVRLGRAKIDLSNFSGLMA